MILLKALLEHRFCFFKKPVQFKLKKCKTEKDGSNVFLLSK